MSAGVHNPYHDAGARWLRGEIHAHVDRSGSGRGYDTGAPPSAVYAAARAAGLDFVGMAVEVSAAKEGIAGFGHVGTGQELGVTGIPGREIQNDAHPEYFEEAGARYLHVLTLGERDGLSICVHPLFYEVASPRAGGEWARIRAALFDAAPTSRLARLAVSGIEIYNGFARRRLLRQGEAHRYERYDEPCWDDVLMQGRRWWGFAGNDSLIRAGDGFDTFSPLGVVYAAVAEGQAADDILGALRAGRFYSSTGVRLADEPIDVHADDVTLRVAVTATTDVTWSAKVFHRKRGQWTLSTVSAPQGPQAQFTVEGDWQYVRLRCEATADPWQRAWLQPITRDAYFHPPRGDRPEAPASRGGER